MYAQNSVVQLNTKNMGK